MTDMAEVTRRHPDITLTIVEASLHDLQSSVLDGTVEAAVMYDLDIGPEIEHEILVGTRSHVIVSGTHKFARRSNIKLGDLADQPMVMLDVHPSEIYFRNVLARFGIEPIIEHTTGSFETLPSLVARGVGWGMLIGRPTIDVSYEGLPVNALTISDPIEPTPVVLAWPRQARLTRRAEAFRAVCHEVLG
jgi:DNA-binding transcriptional LysR family regulator